MSTGSSGGEEAHASGRLPAREGWSRLSWVLAGIVLLFVGLATAVLAGVTTDVDRTGLLLLRTAGADSDPAGPPWVEDLMRDVTALGSNGIVFLLVTMVAVGWSLQRRWWSAAVLAAGCVGALFLNHSLKNLFGRTRPDLVPHGEFVATASFPSTHTVMATAGFLLLAHLLGRMLEGRALRLHLFFVASVLAALVGISRVYLGVHWPTDVVGGWLVGVGWVLAWLSTTRALRSRWRKSAD